MFLTYQKNLSFWLENLVNKLWSPTENNIAYICKPFVVIK